VSTSRGSTVYSEPSTSSFITMRKSAETARRLAATVRTTSDRSIERTSTLFARAPAWLGTAEAATSL